MRDPCPEHVLISEFETNFYEAADNVRSMWNLGGFTFYEAADNVRSMWNLGGFTFSHLEWPKFAFPGGYEIHYYAVDGGVLCADCANVEIMRTIDPDDRQFCIGLADINYEDGHLYCDHCNRQIEPAYGDAEREEAAEKLRALGFTCNANGMWSVYKTVGDHLEHPAFDDPIDALDWYLSEGES